MSDQAQTPGGQGDDPPKRSELKLYEQALRNDWPIHPRVRKRLLQRMVNFVDQDVEDARTRSDPEDLDEPPMLPPANGASARTTIAAMRVIVAICNLSLKQQALDLARKRVEGDPNQLTLDQLTQEAEERASQRIDERTADGAAQQVPQ